MHDGALILTMSALQPAPRAPGTIPLPDCAPEELIGLRVERAGRRLGTLVDLALLDARCARFLLVERTADGRIVRLGPDDVDGVAPDGVHLRAGLDGLAGIGARER